MVFDIIYQRRTYERGDAMKLEFTEERREYLNGLAEEYDVDKTAVYALADLLGPNEDHDGLVAELEDFGQMRFMWGDE